MAVYQGKLGSLRIYDGTAVTPQFINVTGNENPNFQGALGRALPTETVRLERGNLNGALGRTPESDVSAVSAIPISFSVLMTEANVASVLPALSNPFNAGTWTVGGGTFVEADQTALQIPDSGGVLRAFPVFTNTLYRLVHVEIALNATTDTIIRYEGVFFQPDQITIQEAQQEVTLTANGLVWGLVTTLSAHTTGTDITT